MFFLFCIAGLNLAFTLFNMSLGTICSLSRITFKKLNGKIYLSWSVLVELWFLGLGFHDHLEHGSSIPPYQIQQWKRTNFQLCALLQSVGPNILTTLRPFKTCNSFYKKVQNVFVNENIFTIWLIDWLF